jgi:hypothetical protein
MFDENGMPMKDYEPEKDVNADEAPDVTADMALVDIVRILMPLDYGERLRTVRALSALYGVGK